MVAVNIENASPGANIGYFESPIIKIGLAAIAIASLLLNQIEWLGPNPEGLLTLLLLITGLFLVLVNHVVWSATLSHHAAVAAFESLDMIAHGKRWRASESEHVMTLCQGSTLFAVTYTLLCKNISGVWYDLVVEASADRVTATRIDKVEEAAARQRLENTHATYTKHFGEPTAA